jgi:Putative transposase
MRLLTRQGLLIEKQGMTYLAEPHSDTALTPLAKRLPAPTASHLRPRAGQKVLSLQSLPSTGERSTPGLCTNAHGFSLHAAVRCGADQRKQLEHLCRYITRPATS